MLTHGTVASYAMVRMYAYVGADPVNFTEPSGLASCPAGETLITPTGSRIPRCVSESLGPGQASSSNTNRGALLSGGGGAALAEADGGYVCVKNCGPSTVLADGTIVITAPKYEWITLFAGFGTSDEFHSAATSARNTLTAHRT